MKIIFYSIATILILIAATSASLVFWLDTDTFKTQIEKAVEDATGMPLLIEGTPEISIFPTGFKMGTAFWGYKDGKPNPEGISVAIKNSAISIELMPLLSKKVVVRTIILIDPSISIINLKPAEIKEKPKSESVQIPESTEALAIELQNISINNATVVVKNMNGVDFAFKNFNATINDLSPNALSNIAVNTYIELEQIKDKKKQIIFAGNLDLKTALTAGKDNITIKKLNVKIKPEKSSLIDLTEPVELSASGAYTFKTKEVELGNIKISSNFVNLSLESKDNSDKQNFIREFAFQADLPKILKLLQINMAQGKIPQNLTLAGRISYEKEKNNIYLKDIKGKIDTTNIDANLNILSFNSMKSMDITGKFNIGKLDLTPYLATAAPAEQKKAAPTAKQGEIILPKNLPKMNIEFNMEGLSIEGVVLKKIQAIITSEGGIYKLEPLKFTIASGGTFSGNIVADANNNKYNVEVKADAINVGNLLQAYSGSAPIGALAVFEAKLTTSGTSINNIIGNLAGTGLLLAEDVVLTIFSIIPKAILGDAVVPKRFHTLSVPFTSEKGIIVAKPIELLENKQLTVQKHYIRGDAVLDLPAAKLEANFDAKLDKITIPILISGPFSKLSYGFNTKKTAIDILKRTIFKGIESKETDETKPIKKSIKKIFDAITKE